MHLLFKEYTKAELQQITAIWNQIVEEEISFPQDKPFTLQQAKEFFALQTAVVCACNGSEVAGFYILHPNNTGRCGHIANASYGGKKEYRGTGGGKQLVTHSLTQTKEHGFIALQFNAVVCTNTAAVRLYNDLGFTQLCKVENGYKLPDGNYVDTLLFYKAV